MTGLNTTSDFIALSSAVIALLALVATLWQGHAARAHSRLSVRPHLDWGTEMFLGKPVTLYVINGGLGPAVIDSFSFTFDGVPYGLDGIQFPPPMFAETRKIGLNTPIPSGMRVTVLECDPRGSPGAHNEAVRFLNRLGMVVVYRSMYGEKFTLTRTPDQPGPTLA